MTIQKYVKEQRKLLDKFEQFWEKRSLRKPDMYPPDLPIGDWEEQFHSFVISTLTKESTS